MKDNECYERFSDKEVLFIRKGDWKKVIAENAELKEHLGTQTKLADGRFKRMQQLKAEYVELKEHNEQLMDDLVLWVQSHNDLKQQLEEQKKYAEIGRAICWVVEEGISFVVVGEEKYMIDDFELDFVLAAYRGMVGGQ